MSPCLKRQLYKLLKLFRARSLVIFKFGILVYPLVGVVQNPVRLLKLDFKYFALIPEFAQIIKVDIDKFLPVFFIV